MHQYEHNGAYNFYTITATMLLLTLCHHSYNTSCYYLLPVIVSCTQPETL
jgi:hypothetical protein